MRNTKRYHLIFILLAAVILQVNSDAQKPDKKNLDPVRKTRSLKTTISYKNYIWIEAENAVATNFSKEKTYNFYCSGNYALQLSNDTNPPNKDDGYYATYVFYVPQTKSYDFWMGSTPPGSQYPNKPGYASPFDWKIDDGVYRKASAENTYVKKFYAIGGFYWVKISSGKLDAGKHTVTIRINQKRSSGWDYYFYLDALLFLPTYSGDLVSLMKFPERAPRDFKVFNNGIQFNHIDFYKNRIRINKNDRAAIFDLVQIYGWLYDYPKAIELCRNYLQNNPKDIEMRLHLASHLAWFGKVTESINEYNNIIAIDTKNIVSRKQLAVLAGWNNRYDVAIKNYLDIIKIDPHNIDAYINLANQYSWNNQVNKALAIYEQAEKIAPENTDVLHALGDNSRWSGNPFKAIKQYQKIIAIDEKDMQAYKKLAMLYMEMGQKAKADDIIEEATRIQKIYPELNAFSLDVKGEQNKQIQTTITEYKNKLAKFPEDIKTRKNLIDTYRWNKMDKDAVVEYNRLLNMKVAKKINFTNDKIMNLTVNTIELGLLKPALANIKTGLEQLQDFYADIPQSASAKLPEKYTKEQAAQDYLKIQTSLELLQKSEKTLLAFNNTLGIYNRDVQNFQTQKDALSWKLDKDRIIKQASLARQDPDLGYRPELIIGLLELLYGNKNNAALTLQNIYSKNANKIILHYLLALIATGNYNQATSVIKAYIEDKASTPRIVEDMKVVIAALHAFSPLKTNTDNAANKQLAALLKENSDLIKKASLKYKELIAEHDAKLKAAYATTGKLYASSFLDLEIVNVPTYKEIGQYYISQQNMSASLDYYDYILKVQPLNVDINYTLGNLHESTGYWKSAMDNYEICINNQLNSDNARKRHYELQKEHSFTLKNEASYFSEKSVNRTYDKLYATMPLFNWLTAYGGYQLYLIDERGGKSQTGQTFPGLEKGKITAHSGFFKTEFSLIPLSTRMYLEGIGNYYTGMVNFKDYDSYDSKIDYASFNYAAGIQVSSLFKILSMKLGYRHEDLADLSQSLRLNNRDEITSNTIEGTLDFNFNEFKFPFSDRIFLYDNVRYRMLSDSNTRISSYNELTFRLLRFDSGNISIDLGGVYSYETSSFQSYNYADTTKLSLLPYWAPEKLQTYGASLRWRHAIYNFLNGKFEYVLGFQYSQDSNDNINYNPGASISYKGNHVSAELSYYYTKSKIKATEFNPDPDPYISHNVNFSVSGHFFSVYTPKEQGKKAILFITAKPSMITPDGDGKDDYAEVSLNAFDDRGIKSWNLEIFNKDMQKVENIGGKGTPPQTVRWDGTDKAHNVLPQGMYTFQLSIINSGGVTSVSQKDQVFLARKKRAVILETLYPRFSPNGDGQKDTVSFEIQATDKNNIESWKMTILNSGYAIVRTISGFEFLPYDVQWDGKNSSGDLLPDGNYFAEMSILYGDKTRISSPRKNIIIITKASISIKTDKKSFIPGEGKIKILPFYSGQEVTSWKLTLTDSSAQAVRIFQGSGLVPKEIVWDGKDQHGAIAAFNMFIEAQMDLVDIAGNKGSSAKVTIWIGFMKKIKDGRTIFILFDQGVLHDNKNIALKKDSKEIIARLIKKMRSSTSFKNMKITAHTSSEGSTDSNKDLAEKRAALLARELQNGFKDVQITHVGAGESSPYHIENSKWDSRYEIELY